MLKFGIGSPLHLKPDRCKNISVVAGKTQLCILGATPSIQTFVIVGDGYGMVDASCYEVYFGE